MGFVGIGGIEIVVILLVALLVLGPKRMVDVANSAGKIIAEFRKSIGNFTKIVEESDSVEDEDSPKKHIRDDREN